MFDALTQPDRLRAAWKRVRANGGATGGDGETAAAFAADLNGRLARLAKELANGRWPATETQDKGFDMATQSAHCCLAVCCDKPTELTIMTEKHSKSRQQAEIAFAKAQSQFLTRDRVVAETDPTKQARAENTLRLKTARLAREAEDHANVGATGVLKQVNKV